MRKLGRVQSTVLRSLIDHESWTYYGSGNHYMAGWVYDTYKRTYDMLETLEDKGLVEREYTTTPAGTRREPGGKYSDHFLWQRNTSEGTICNERAQKADRESL